MAYSYKYPRPSVTVDCVVFGIDEALKVLLIERGIPPFEGTWALPGGFMRMDETLDQAALRELQEETGLDVEYLEEIGSFSDVERDPRGRVVTVAYYALVKLSRHEPRADTDARNAAWFDIDKVPKLAFDHKKILKASLTRLKDRVRRRPIGFDLLPRKFTLSQLQRLYELILDRELDKRNFRKKVLALDCLVGLDEREKNVKRRPAQLYRFDKRKYRKLQKQGFLFEI